MRKLVVVAMAVALVGCNGNGDEAAPADGGDTAAAAATGQQQQMNQRVQRLEQQLSQREDRVSQLENRVSALEDSIADVRGVPANFVSESRLGCVEWSRDSSYQLCTQQTLSRR